MTTVNEFIESEDLKKILGNKYSKYKSKFIKITEKSKLGECEITDAVVLKKLNALVFNWPAIILGSLWAVFLRLKIGWYVGLGLFWAIFLSDLIIGGTFSVLYLISGSGIVFGLFGTGFYFQHIIKDYNAGSKHRTKKSFLNAIILLIVNVFYIIFCYYFYYYWLDGSLRWWELL